jgi:hypothetical protein
MATCAPGQLPYSFSYFGGPGYSALGSTQHEACYNLGQAVNADLGGDSGAYLEGPSCNVVDAEGNFLAEASNAGSCEPPSEEEGTTITCESACTITLKHDFSTGNPFVMSVADGAAMGFLIIGVWVAALAIRMLIKAVQTSDAE